MAIIYILQALFCDPLNPIELYCLVSCMVMVLGMYWVID